MMGSSPDFHIAAVHQYLQALRAGLMPAGRISSAKSACSQGKFKAYSYELYSI